MATASPERTGRLQAEGAFWLNLSQRAWGAISWFRIFEKEYNRRKYRKGTFLGGAVSFFGIIKSELIYHERLKVPQNTLRAIFEHIAIYYSRKRKHSTLGCKMPAQVYLSRGQFLILRMIEN